MVNCLGCAQLSYVNGSFYSFEGASLFVCDVCKYRIVRKVLHLPLPFDAIIDFVRGPGSSTLQVDILVKIHWSCLAVGSLVHDGVFIQRGGLLVPSCTT